MPGSVAISIVDDDESVREALVELMQSHGYDAEAFDSGASFLSSGRPVITDCLIADIHMPVMSGFELCQRLKSYGHSIPTILVTGRHEVHDRARAQRSGAVCYLTKPFDEGDLLACIAAALAESDGRGRRT